MKKYVGLLLMIVTLVFLIVPVSAQPGTADDPLVSKKYVDDQINSLKTLIDSAGAGSGGTQTEITAAMRDVFLAEALAGFEAAYGDMLRRASANADVPQTPSTPDTSAGAPVFEVVFAEKGRVIYGDASTEIILRGGAATAVSGVDGLSDVTGGVDIKNGQNIPYNHLLIVPRDDGRGLKITTDAYLMIKGGYYFA